MRLQHDERFWDVEFYVLVTMQERFLSPQQVTISTRSSLVVSGDVTIEHLDLDGALVLCVDPGAQLTIRSLVVRNKGWIVVRNPPSYHMQ